MAIHDTLIPTNINKPAPTEAPLPTSSLCRPCAGCLCDFGCLKWQVGAKNLHVDHIDAEYYCT